MNGEILETAKGEGENAEDLRSAITLLNRIFDFRRQYLCQYICYALNHPAHISSRGCLADMTLA